MLTYTPVSEAGGVGKTSTAATLAVSHARAGHDVLAIDMDTQNGSLTYLFGPEYDRGNPSVDNLVRHLVGRPKGEFADLTHRVEHGVDLIPSHNMLEDIHEFLLNEKNQAEKLGESYSVYHQLHRVLREANVRENYDVIIVDSAGKAGPILYNPSLPFVTWLFPSRRPRKARSRSRDSTTSLADSNPASTSISACSL
jgi:cellulose biosynthesis protein BcsQ